MEKKAEKQEIRYAWRINVYFPGGKWVAGQKYYATRKECEDANREWLDKHPACVVVSVSSPLHLFVLICGG